MSDVLSPILQWINTHPELAGLITFGISTAESVAIIGTIIPGTVMMTAIGTLAGAGVIPLWPTLIWAILGAIVGDGISYWLGRHFNERLPFIWPFRKYPNLLQNGENFFHKYGSMSVLIGRFVGPVRALVPLVAGMLGMKPVRFYIANILSAIGWAPIYMLPGILLGAASLELPPEVAMHVIFALLMTLLFIMFSIWLIQRLLTLISRQVDQFLTGIWNRLAHSSYFHLIPRLLKHRDPVKTHGQLVLTFYLLALCSVLILLMLYIFVQGPLDITINQIVFHLFRSFRTPSRDSVMLAITFLGEKTVILPAIALLFGWLAYTKRWYTAWHVLALGILAAGSIEITKLIAHSPRPWGLAQSPADYSFPSGHATLAVVYFFGLAFLLLQPTHIKYRRFIYYPVAGLIVIISLTRLYLGVHWFTDILGGWLLGAIVCVLVTISYNRNPKEYFNPGRALLVGLLALSMTYSFYAYRHFDRLKQNYAVIEWPTHALTLEAWWFQQGKNLPFYRINRFGLSSQVLNLQWVGNLFDIQKNLLQNGWAIPPQNNWINVLHRLSDVNSAEHLPLVEPLYLDKNPVLTLIKQMKGNKKLIVLRLWDSRITFTNSTNSLWVGSVEVTPRTYNWLFKHKPTAIALTPQLLFTMPPAAYDIKEVTVRLNKSFQPRTQHMLLIKPKP